MRLATCAWTGAGTRTNTTSNYTEVGVFTLRLEDATYANVDANDGSSAATRTVPAAGTTLTVGRFVPDRFTFTGPSTPQLQTFGSACGTRSFTYVGQPFWYVTLPSATLNAVNANGSTTSNYKGFGNGSNGTDLFHLTASGFSETYNDSAGPAMVKGSAVSPTQLTGVGSGTATYTATASAANVNISHTRSATTPIVPFTANISLTVTATDSSENGVVGNPGNAATATLTSPTSLSFSSIAFDSGSIFRYGIVRMLDVFAPLAGNSTGVAPVAVQALYWNSAGTAFDPNILDSCTSFAAGNFNLQDHRGAITAANLPNAKIVMGVATLASGTGRVDVSATSTAPAPISSITQPGTARLCLDLDASATQTDNSCVATTPSDKAYLQGPWSGTSYFRDPTATVGFGVFGSQPRNFIYFRENY